MSPMPTKINGNGFINSEVTPIIKISNEVPQTIKIAGMSSTQTAISRFESFFFISVQPQPNALYTDLLDCRIMEARDVIESYAAACWHVKISLAFGLGCSFLAVYYVFAVFLVDFMARHCLSPRICISSLPRF